MTNTRRLLGDDRIRNYLHEYNSLIADRRQCPRSQPLHTVQDLAQVREHDPSRLVTANSDARPNLTQPVGLRHSARLPVSDSVVIQLRSQVAFRVPISLLYRQTAQTHCVGEVRPFEEQTQHIWFRQGALEVLE
jgi:hypothetical protein